MADQIKEQESRQAPPANSSSPAPDQKPPLPPEDNSQRETDNKEKPGRRTSVFLYLVVLFAAAFTMLFMAYLMQQRANDSAISSLQDSLSSFESIDELLRENQELRVENETLQQQTGKLEEQLQQAQNSADTWQQRYEDQSQEWESAQVDIQTWQALWRIEYFYQKGDLEACAQQYTLLSASDDYIPPEDTEALSRFQAIFDELVEQGYLDESLRTALFPASAEN